MTPQGAPQKSNTTTVVLIVLAVGGVSLFCCVATLAAIAVPNFVKFNVRARQAEVKANLKSAYAAQRAYFDDKDTYSESIDEVGFLPERSNRYRYVFAPASDSLFPGSPDGGAHNGVLADQRPSPPPDNATLLAGIPPALLAEAGLHGKCPEACHITMLAVGNLDGDSDVDVWSISTMVRTIGGVSVPAGQPYNDFDDVK